MELVENEILNSAFLAGIVTFLFLVIPVSIVRIINLQNPQLLWIWKETIMGLVLVFVYLLAFLAIYPNQN